MSVFCRLYSFESAGCAFRQILKSAILSDNVFKCREVKCSLFSRGKSTSRPTNERVVITDDGSTIVCWHPIKPFPYECSKPLPETPVMEHSVLKVQNSSDIFEVFKSTKEEQVREELMKITHTTKHRWFPNKKRDFNKKKIFQERENI